MEKNEKREDNERSAKDKKKGSSGGGCGSVSILAQAVEPHFPNHRQEHRLSQASGASPCPKALGEQSHQALTVATLASEGWRPC